MSLSTWKSNSQLLSKRRNHYKKSDRPKTRPSRTIKTSKQFKRSNAWKNNSSNWHKRRRNKWSLSTRKRNKSENFTKRILWRRRKLRRSKLSWRRRKKKATRDSRKKSINTPLISWRRRSRNWRIRGHRWRNRETKRLGL